MDPTVADVIAVMASIAPPELAEPWDNPGLQVGCGKWPVRKVLVALDPAPEVVAAACDRHADLLVTHHPLLMQPLRSIDFATPAGGIIRMAASRRLTIFSAHTNYDAVAGGVNDILAQRIGLGRARPFDADAAPAGHGIGRVGDLREASTLGDFAQRVKTGLMIASVRCCGPLDRRVERVAVCSGSGAGLLAESIANGADVLVTGDVKYHDARTAEWAGMGLVDIGHFASEHLLVPAMVPRLESAFGEAGMDIDVEACLLEKDPFVIV